MFFDYRAALSTIIPNKLVSKLQDFGPNQHLCTWIMGTHHSSSLILNTSVLQGCVLSPLLYINDCVPVHSANIIITYADDTTAIRLVSDNDESGSDNSLSLNTSKTSLSAASGKEVVDTLQFSSMETRVSSLKFLSVHMSEDVSWAAKNHSTVKEGRTTALLYEVAKESKP